MNVKEKGNRGERELAKILREYGYSSRRGLQYQSGQIEADVVGIPGIHIECKRVQGLNVRKAMEQSIRDAKDGEKPVVIHRENRKPWNVTMMVGDLAEIVTGMKSDRKELVTMLLIDWLEIIGGKNEPKDNDTEIPAKTSEAGHDQRGRHACAHD